MCIGTKYAHLEATSPVAFPKLRTTASWREFLILGPSRENCAQTKGDMVVAKKETNGDRN